MERTTLKSLAIVFSNYKNDDIAPLNGGDASSSHDTSPPYLPFPPPHPPQTSALPNICEVAKPTCTSV